jgi:hypothetical protein
VIDLDESGVCEACREDAERRSSLADTIREENAASLDFDYSLNG